MSIDSAIATIIAREVLESCMFITSHLGSVLKNEHLSTEQRALYIKWISLGIVVGALGGFLISIGVGFGLAEATHDLDKVELGIEAGEGVSKLIGAYFVTKLMFKIPKWFGMSNYVDEVTKALDEVATSATKGEVIYTALETPQQMSFNLAWNICREFAEAGCFTSLQYIFSKPKPALGPSVGVGISSVICVGIILTYWGRSFSFKAFGILVSVIVELLAIGLFTGTVQAFEEVSELNGTGEGPAVFSFSKDSNAGGIINSFGFIGLEHKFSVAALVTWVFFAVVLTTLQIRHNVYGLPINPFRCFSKEEKSLVQDELEEDHIELPRNAKDKNGLEIATQDDVDIVV